MDEPIDGFLDAVDFYFDFSSPYGYLAAGQIEAIAERHRRSVTWRPILLGAIFKVTKQQPLAEIPLKREYMQHDLERFARLCGLPFRLPSRFPIGSTTACRAFYSVADRDAALAKRFAWAIYQAYFVHDRDVSAPEVVLDVAADNGIDRAGLAAELNEPALKDRLRGEVDAAIARGVFGSPYIVVDDEAFWGADRLDQVERWLETGGW